MFATKTLPQVLVARMSQIIDSLQPHLMYFIYFSLVILAFFWRRHGRLPQSWLTFLTRLLISLVYPALIISSLTHNFRRPQLSLFWDLPAALALLMAMGALLGWISLRFHPGLKTALPDNLRRSFLFMAAMPNFVFLPLTLCSLLLDDSYLGYIILASFGGDLFLWMVAVPLIGHRRGGLIRAFAKPPVIAMLVSLLVIMVDCERIFDGLDTVYGGLQTFGKLTIPLSLFILGAHLAAKPTSEPQTATYQQANRLLLAHRFLLTPLSAQILISLLQMPSEHAQVLTLISFMPTAIASAILTPFFGGDPNFCARQVFDSHCLSVVIIPIAAWLLL